MRAFFAFAVLLVALWPASGHARLRSETITSTNTTTTELTFHVAVQDHGNLIFTVEVSAAGKTSLSTNLVGCLFIRDADGLVAVCPTSSALQGDKLTFTFTLHRKLVRDSEFTVSSRHDIGKIAAGTVYYVKLASFTKHDGS